MILEGGVGGEWVVFEVAMNRGTSPIRKRPPPKDPLRTLGKGLQ